MIPFLPDDVLIAVMKNMKPADIANVYWCYKSDKAFMSRLEKMFEIDDIDWYAVFQHIYELEIVEEILYDQEVDEFQDDAPLEHHQAFFDENSFVPFSLKTESFDFDEEAFMDESFMLRDGYSQS
jgi:hypothetical protein